MGQQQSSPTASRSRATPAQLSEQFAQRCAKTFSGIELYTLKKNITDLCDQKDGESFWTQDTLVKFLQIPDTIPHAGDLLYKSNSFLGAFPMLRTLSPTLLTLESMVKVVAIYNGRYKTLVSSEYDSLKLLFLSFAVIENSKGAQKSRDSLEDPNDDPKAEDIETADDDFDLSALDDLDELEVIVHFDQLDSPEVDYYISAQDLQSIFTLMLAVFTFKPFESLDSQAYYFVPENTKLFRTCATAMLRTMHYDLQVGTKIRYPEFRQAVLDHYPEILSPLGRLYDQLLFDQKTRRKNSLKQLTTTETNNIFIDESKILSVALKNQMMNFLPLELDSSNEFIKLYSGSSHGFSMRAFETKVFKWNAPTLFLISGKRYTTGTTGAKGRSKFLDQQVPLLHKQRTGGAAHNKVTFGAYIVSPWKNSSKECFSKDSGDALLFQLSPVHEVYKPSLAHKDYAYFCDSGKLPGIGFGSPVPYRQISLGNLSLTVDESFEYAIFRHAGLGGSYRPGSTSQEYEELFSVEEVEVWGVGRTEDLEEQKRKWQWEENEAQRRRHVNLNGGDLREERALLEMAGLLHTGAQSGGSV